MINIMTAKETREDMMKMISDHIGKLNKNLLRRLIQQHAKRKYMWFSQ